ncbi:Restriction endonuclease S subunit [gamma proteobacterium IMCC1989]|nr:Restriction endonuclease S subunit [gamma proteobacterium IMCC1989]
MNQKKWTTKSLGKLSKFKSGGTPSKSNPKFWGGDIPWVTAKDMKTPLINNSIDKLTTEALNVAKLAPTNTLLILVRGMTLHKDLPLAITKKELAFNQDIKALTTCKEILPMFLMIYLSSQKHKVLKLVDSAGHGTGRLDTDLLKSFPVNYPSIFEQKKIVDTLVFWDNAIEKTETLIAAKENQFKWLTQKLFKPTASWQSYKLSDLFENRRETKNVDLPLISITREKGVIPHSETNRKDNSNEDKSKYLRIRPNDIGYNTMRMWQGVSALSTIDGIVSPAYTVCKPKKIVNPEFMAFLFKTKPMIHKFYRYSQGLTSDTWNLKFHHFSEVKASIPDIETQSEIAKSLNSAKKEIDTLRKISEKYRIQKRGLMQKMLTGEWQVSTQYQTIEETRKELSKELTEEKTA